MHNKNTWYIFYKLLNKKNTINTINYNYIISNKENSRQGISLK